jgi:cation diffusion facilitator CzcD-associated flavoprotein CzcO
VQAQARQLTVVQRTPPWIMPRGDRAIAAWRRALYRALPVTQRLERAALYAFREAMIVPFRHPRLMRLVALSARRHLHAQVRDPVLRDRLTPHYALGCKRILLSDDYYPALVQPNVELVTDAITGFTRDAMQTAAGRTIPVDTVIFATGFRPTDPPLAPVIVGRDGASLAQAWRGSPKAYMGTTMAGFPNLFFLLGPNTGLGHSSLVPLIEAQVAHVMGVLDLMHAVGADTVEPSADAQAAYVAWIDAALETTVWNSGGCRSWYLDRSGRNSALWPFRVGRFTRTVARPRAEDYVFEMELSDPQQFALG